MSIIKEKAQVIMLPSTKPVKLNQIFKSPLTGKNLMISVENEEKYAPKRLIPQHLYIVSDEEIEKGDWVYNVKENIIDKITSKVDLIFVLEENKENQTFKKIIASTDTLLETTKSIKHSSPNNISGKRKELIVESIPQPSQGFIEKYVKEYNKGNIITDILVSYHFIGGVNGMFKSKTLLVDDKNTITIHPIKNSWNREEVIEVIKEFNKDKPGNFDVFEWIEENL